MEKVFLGSTPSWMTGWEQGLLGHGRQQEGDGIPPVPGQFPGHLLPMDIVDLDPRSGGYVLVQEGLKRSHRQLGTWVGDHHLSLPIGTDIGQDMCTAIRLPASERTGIKSLQGGQQLPPVPRRTPLGG